MHRLHPYPDLQAMFRRLLIATVIGLLAALAVAQFRHAMLVLEWLFLSNDTGESGQRGNKPFPVTRRRWLPLRSGGLAAGIYFGDGKRSTGYARTPHRLHGSPADWRRQFRTSVQAW